MKIAITGGTGFIGRHLAERLLGEGHQIVLLGRAAPRKEKEALSNAEFVTTDLSNIQPLVQAFEGCHAVAHCAGINREIGPQTFRGVHIEATRNVVAAAKTAGVQKMVLMSFLRARPDCGSNYHESKWAAEELFRNSGLDYTILKAGIVYGRGDHMLDHLSQALHTLPFFATVGLEEKTVRPLAVEDLVHVMRAALIDRRLKKQTVAVVGPEEIYLSEAVRRVSEVVGKTPIMFPMPIWFHRLLAHFFELTMKVPLASLAQVRILSEGVTEAATPVSALPYDLVPTRRFTLDQIRNGLPHPGPFSVANLRLCH
ncbi:MAG TPA: NAD(P)H-binding protein [Pyrinomonadaceae bacterium]